MKAIIFGAGRMGRRFIDVCKNNNLEVAGVFDISTSALQAVSLDHNIKADACYSNPKRMVSETQADVAIIASTTPTHALYAMMAASSGTKFILMEKPVGLDISEMSELQRVSDNTGAIIAVNHQMRHIEEYKNIKSLLVDEKLGEIVTMAVQGGNAGLAMNGTHILELFHYLTDSKIEYVSGWLRSERTNNPRGNEYFDPGGSIRGFNENASLFIDFDTRSSFGYHLTINTTHGQICADLISGKTKIACRKNIDKTKTTALYSLEPNITEFEFTPTDAITSSTLVLRELLLGNDGNFTTLDEGIYLTRTILAAYASHQQNHKTVRVSDPMPEIKIDYHWA